MTKAAPWFSVNNGRMIHLHRVGKQAAFAPSASQVIIGPPLDPLGYLKHSRETH